MITVSMPDQGEAGILIVDFGRGRGLKVYSGSPYSTWGADEVPCRFRQLHDALSAETRRSLHAEERVALLTTDADYAILKTAHEALSIRVRTRAKRN